MCLCVCIGYKTTILCEYSKRKEEVNTVTTGHFGKRRKGLHYAIRVCICTQFKYITFTRYMV